MRVFQTVPLGHRFCAVGLCALLGGLAASSASANITSTLTFEEPLMVGPGFNGRINQALNTLDGFYRAEAFWLAGPGHFHLHDGQNWNHNFTAFVGGNPNYIQGIRITKNDDDGALFDLVSMDLFGQAAVGFLNLADPGLSTWTLFTDTSGTMAQPATVNFGGQFNNVSEIYIIDPGIFYPTGRMGNSGPDAEWSNRWDNIVMEMFVGTEVAEAIVPEPSSAVLTLLSICGLVPVAIARRRRRGKIAR